MLYGRFTPVVQTFSKYFTDILQKFDLPWVEAVRGARATFLDVVEVARVPVVGSQHVARERVLVHPLVSGKRLDPLCQVARRPRVRISIKSINRK